MSETYQCAEGDPRVPWYRQKAEEAGRLSIIYTKQQSATLAELFAREAGHWAGLVVGLESLRGETLVVMRCRVAIEEGIYKVAKAEKER